ncbi:MAG: indole-3-glycerol-phosphate synthase [Verrucomicrobia bacterium]|nr:indole-3-glycerol-phosphate synthase [Verrucomicrobiota bacterium]
MKTIQSILDDILLDVRRELAAAKEARSLAELKRLLADAPPIRSFTDALRARFGVIAEIKERSPSQGPMRRENVEAAPAAYERSPIVRGISVLTNATHFGMNIERLRDVKTRGTKPVLRKDFIFDDYQVYEARAFGADAILLMANLLEADELRRLYALARELGMEALFECHTREQIESVPSGASLYGINSRTFAVSSADYAEARRQRAAGSPQDLTTDLRQFELIRHLPAHAIKVAESGVHPETVCALRDDLGYHAALVGTSLLTARHGVARELEAFERALTQSPQTLGGKPGSAIAEGQS